MILIGWILDLIRRGRLYVGYGVLFLVFLTAVAIAVSAPGLLSASERLVRIVFPVEPLALIGLGFLGFLQIYILSQLTILSNRLASVVQELALRGCRMGNIGDEAQPPSGTR